MNDVLPYFSDQQSERERSLYEILSEHIGYIRTNKETTVEHFKVQVHTLGDMRATVLKKWEVKTHFIQKKERLTISDVSTPFIKV